jgi:hypothetical protein
LRIWQIFIRLWATENLTAAATAVVGLLWNAETVLPAATAGANLGGRSTHTQQLKSKLSPAHSSYINPPYGRDKTSIAKHYPIEISQRLLPIGELIAISLTRRIASIPAAEEVYNGLR